MHALDLEPVDGIVSNIGSGLEAGRDNVLATIRTGRDRLTDVDLEGASRSAIEASRSAIQSARDAIPEGWPGHVRRQRSRWPMVALVVTGVAILSFVLMAPVFRRWTASSKAAAETAAPMTSDVRAVDPGIVSEDAPTE